MKPWELLGETRTPDGSDVRLTRQDSEYVILVDGKTLMSSRRHGSEDALATLACPHLRSAESRTSSWVGSAWASRCARRSTCSRRPPRHRRRAPAGGRRVEPRSARSARRSPSERPARQDRGRRRRAGLRASAGTIRCDPARRRQRPPAFTAPAIAGCTTTPASAAACAALERGGVLAVWSARDDRKFEQRLRFHGFAVQVDARAGPTEEGRTEARDLSGVKARGVGGRRWAK